MLTGRGRKATITDKRAAIAEAIEGGNFFNAFKNSFKSVAALAKKIAPVVLPIMADLGKKKFGGGFNFGKFLTKIGKTGVGKEATRIGKPLVRKARKAIKEHAPKATAAMKKVADKIIDNPEKTGSILEEAIEKTKPLIRKGKKELKSAIKENAPKATAYLKNKADRGIKKAVGGGRAARAELVKKIMKEKGMKMIEASKYVKEHGLYKK